MTERRIKDGIVRESKNCSFITSETLDGNRLYSERSPGHVNEYNVYSSERGCNAVYNGKKCGWRLPADTPLPQALVEYGKHNKLTHGSFNARLIWIHKVAPTKVEEPTYGRAKFRFRERS